MTEFYYNDYFFIYFPLITYFIIISTWVYNLNNTIPQNQMIARFIFMSSFPFPLLPLILSILISVMLRDKIAIEDPSIIFRSFVTIMGIILALPMIYVYGFLILLGMPIIK
jgi:hypothetical protein